jgi:hypothetical protein
MKKDFSFYYSPCNCFSQHSKQDSIWLPLKSFIGAWREEGERGKGKYERSNKFTTCNPGNNELYLMT